MNRKYRGIHPVRNICKTGVRTDMTNKIFASCIRTRLMEIELYNGKGGLKKEDFSTAKF